MKNSTKRFAAATVALALTALGLAGAQAAYANEVTPTPTITLLDQADQPITSGSTTASRMFYGITVSTGCPVGFRDGGSQVIFQNGVRLANVAQTRNASTTNFGALGLSGEPISLLYTTTAPAPNNAAAFRNLNDPAFAALVDGPFELRVYCFAVYTSPNYATDAWYTVPLVFDSAASTWALDVPAAPNTPTTTSLTAAAQPDDTAILTATVKKQSDGTTATAATGTVDFLDGATVVGSDIPVTAGVATFTTAVLSDGEHSFTAVYSGDDDYDPSTSAPAAVTVGAYATVGVNVDVVIPSGIGELTLTVPSGVVHLDGDPSTGGIQPAVLTGGVLTASGSLPNLTVNDTRQLDAPDWELTGVAGNFTSGSYTILAKYLGWTPVHVSGPGVAGASVAPAPGTPTGLSVTRSLATGAVTDGQPTTVVKADLNLAAPANTPAGTYSSTITITLL